MPNATGIYWMWMHDVFVYVTPGCVICKREKHNNSMLSKVHEFSFMRVKIMLFSKKFKLCKLIKTPKVELE